MENADFYTVPEAAQLLRIGREHAYDLIKSGALPSIRLGKAIRVPRGALMAVLEQRALQSVGDPAGP